MDRIQSPTWRAIATGALYYGVGAVLGALFSYLLIRFGVLNLLFFWVPEDQPLVEALTGLFAVLIGIGIGGGLAGALGGQALARIDPLYTRRKYMWRSGIAIGLTLGLLSILLILLTALVGLYNPGSTREPWAFIALFAIYGLLYGLVSGLILGFSTVRLRDSWRVILASLVGFTLGGALFGYGMWRYFVNAIENRSLIGSLIGLLVLWFLMFALGGAFLGWAYSSIGFRRGLARGMEKPLPKLIRAAFIVVGVVLALSLISNFRQIIDFVTIQPGSLSVQLPIHTLGVHWDEPRRVSLVLDGPAAGYALASGASSQALVWAAQEPGYQEVFLAWITGSLEPGGTDVAQINISNSPTDSSYPQIVLDGTGIAHVVWSESSEAGSQILYARCDLQGCSAPEALSNAAELECLQGVSEHVFPAIAIDRQDQLLVTWEADGNLPFVDWPAAESPPDSPAGCVPGVNVQEEGPLLVDLAGGEAGEYSLAYSASGMVFSQAFSGGAWDASPQMLGDGTAVDVYADQGGAFQYAWCAPDRLVNYLAQGSPVERLAFPPCITRPALVQGASGQMHLLWYSDQVQTIFGKINPGQFLYESLRTPEGWSEAATVAQTAIASQPVLAAQPGGALYMAWADSQEEGPTMEFATQPDYQCSETNLSALGQVILDVAQDEQWRPAGFPVPFCQNRFLGFIYMPNPEPAFSNIPPTPNGGFDRVDNIASLVRYELDFVTMEYAPDENNTNPGSVLADEIAALYQQIKEDPSRYPRGLTVRVLLGNYPELSNFVWGEQVYDAIADLQEAGVEEMVNEEIGWKLEVANYEGTFPHAHTKFIVIDGQYVMGAGFNYGYLHLPREHPSNKGDNLTDLALIIQGPIAQDALAAYGDLWDGGNQVHCADLSTGTPEIWQATCEHRVALISHLPEVMKFSPQDVETNSFSLFRNYNHKVGDQAIAATLASAQATLDIFEVNFSLELICMLDLLNDDVCDYDNRLPYLDSIMTAVEQNDVKVRVLVEKSGSNGLENRVTFKEFERELERRGLADNVELRWFKDRMHTKAVLIDDELLFVGSQNFHYSAWGDRGLAEYSVVSDDPQAVETFRSMYNYYWDMAIPFESEETASQ